MSEAPAPTRTLQQIRDEKLARFILSGGGEVDVEEWVLQRILREWYGIEAQETRQ